MSFVPNLTEKLKLDTYIKDTIGSLNKFKNYSSYCKYVSTHKCLRSFKDMLNYLYYYLFYKMDNLIYFYIIF